jgi:hypothetical protein
MTDSVLANSLHVWAFDVESPTRPKVRRPILHVVIGRMMNNTTPTFTKILGMHATNDLTRSCFVGAHS